jgi:hypothetical protein
MKAPRLAANEVMFVVAKVAAGTRVHGGDDKRKGVTIDPRAHRSS